MLFALFYRYRKTLVALFSWFLLCNSTFVNAAIIKGLYDAKVEVFEQTQRSQRSAAREALTKVLVKVSGSKDILQHQDISKKLRSASDYLRAYRFDLQDNKLFYLASFDAQKIDQLIMEAGFPIWDSRRPDSLMWLAIEDASSLQKTVVAEGSQLDLLALLNNKANERGIKISFPLMDLQDLQQINAYDIWGRFSQNIELASKRYSPDFVISARIYRHENQGESDEESVDGMNSRLVAPWLADWLLITKGSNESGQIGADNVKELLSLLVDLLADNLSGKFAIDNQTLNAIANKVEIKVTNMADLRTYVEVSRFLSSLALVSKLTLVKQHGSEGTFALEVLGEQSDLVNALLLDQKLSPHLDNFGLPRSELEFVWAP